MTLSISSLVTPSSTKGEENKNPQNYMYTSPKYKKHTTHIIMYKLQNQEEGNAPPPSTPLGKNSNFSPFRNYFIIDRWFLHLNNHFPKKNYLNPSLQGFFFFIRDKVVIISNLNDFGIPYHQIIYMYNYCWVNFF